MSRRLPRILLLEKLFRLLFIFSRSYLQLRSVKLVSKSYAWQLLHVSSELLKLCLRFFEQGSEILNKDPKTYQKYIKLMFCMHMYKSYTCRQKCITF
ncbi:hypothetical protein EUTSA_v10019373mg [Eutrema salsugineum]|uniref:Secreted protein n=1 Tax=Eutrema salsugineum TaxID=72664 RepID=V4KC95_EUTSA|nr:hypothetical protein EUTSA_v10019373mg [Eutrema salsugineum]